MNAETQPGFFRHFKEVEDPRRDHPTTHHQLFDIIAITILATICGASNWVEIESWGKAKHSWLKSFLELPEGIPSHDTFGRVFALLDPEQLSSAFISWIGSLVERVEGLVALDGKTVRRSVDSANGRGPIHIVSAWAAENELVLAQMRVDDKSNEIVALPAVLGLLDLNECVVTIDAMGCQLNVAQAIVDDGGDYILRVKDNQPNLHSDIERLFDWAESPQRSQDETLQWVAASETDGGHGRVEERELLASEELEGLASTHRWPGIKSVERVTSYRHIKDHTSVEKRYYISSLPARTPQQAKRLNTLIRAHWQIENRVHWVLDVAMDEDINRTRKGHSAENLALIRKLVLNLLRHEKTAKCGIQAKQKLAGWDHDYLLKVLQES